MSIMQSSNKFTEMECVTERRTYHHVPLCIACDCYSMAYLSVVYQACGFFWFLFGMCLVLFFRDSGKRQHKEESNKGSSLTEL